MLNTPGKCLLSGLIALFLGTAQAAGSQKVVSTLLAPQFIETVHLKSHTYRTLPKSHCIDYMNMRSATLKTSGAVYCTAQETFSWHTESNAEQESITKAITIFTNRIFQNGGQASWIMVDGGRGKLGVLFYKGGKYRLENTIINSDVTLTIYAIGYQK